jgi:hypothetical protein
MRERGRESLMLTDWLEWGPAFCLQGTLFTGQREREKKEGGIEWERGREREIRRGREREIRRVRERENEKEGKRETEGEGERGGEREWERGGEWGRERCRYEFISLLLRMAELLFLFLKGMIGALAPFSYLVYIYIYVYI